MVVDAKSLKNMVGPCGLEPQTSTVSKLTRLLGTAKYLIIRSSRTHLGLAFGLKRGQFDTVAIKAEP
jgi:hypothetical protein